MTTQHTPDQIHDLANKLERDPSEWGGVALGWKAAARLRELQARIAELEAQLYAIGAGGVGASIQPQAQPDTAQIPDVRIRTSAPDAPHPPAAQQNPVGYMRWKNGSAEYVSVKRWEVPFDGDWHTIYTTPQPTENLRCKSTQKRLAMLWGYVKQEPARQPLPADTYTALAHRIATKYAHRSDPAFCGYAFLPNTLEQFVRAIEQAHGITGGQ